MAACSSSDIFSGRWWMWSRRMLAEGLYAGFVKVVRIEKRYWRYLSAFV
jgi:hypothetical protein